MYKLVNGVSVELTTEEIAQREADEAAWASKQADYIANRKYIDDRISGTFDENGKRLTNGYPDIGDQLDAIWKQLIQDRLNGHAMIQEVDDLIGQINAVKAAHPKPE